MVIAGQGATKEPGSSEGLRLVYLPKMYDEFIALLAVTDAVGPLFIWR